MRLAENEASPGTQRRSCTPTRLRLQPGPAALVQRARRLTRARRGCPQARRSPTTAPSAWTPSHPRAPRTPAATWSAWTWRRRTVSRVWTRRACPPLRAAASARRRRRRRTTQPTRCDRTRAWCAARFPRRCPSARCALPPTVQRLCFGANRSSRGWAGTGDGRGMALEPSTTPRAFAVYVKPPARA
jgi:hypothetical protein